MTAPAPRCDWCPQRATTVRWLTWGPYALCRECADAFDHTR